MRNIQTFMGEAAKFAVLLLLGTICTVLSIISLPSIGLGIVLLSEQAATWSRTSEWKPVPLAAFLQKPGYVHWPPIQSGLELLLSLESGLVVIVAAASVWSLAMILFDQALQRWRPPARIF
jgi:hypothetical protein